MAEQPSLTIPFRLRDFDGLVEVHYGVNEDPPRWGMQYLEIADPTELHLAIGYPVLLATVQYAAEGFASELQWVQLVTTRVHDAPPEVMCDTAPQMAGVAMPFMSFGVKPVLFDAPVRLEAGLWWHAESFLTHTPDVLMSKVVAPVCGFTWGFDIEADGPQVHELVVLDGSAWTEARGHLARMYPDWRFEHLGRCLKTGS